MDKNNNVNKSNFSRIDSTYQTLKLAVELKVALYSDEHVLRDWSIKEYKIKAFSTISVINHLKDLGVVSSTQESELVTQMIRKNFRFVPFTSAHLFSRLREIIAKKGKDYSVADLKNDQILSTFFKQFADTSIDSSSLMRIAREFWLSILTDNRLKRDLASVELVDRLLVQCMLYPTFSYSILTQGQEDRIAALWATFLWGAFRIRKDNCSRVWSCLKPVVKRCLKIMKLNMIEYSYIFPQMAWAVRKLRQQFRC
jgi:hypothetical protein